MKFKYTNIVSNSQEIEKIRDKESPYFPLDWFKKYPADDYGDSLLQTMDEVLEVETRDFDDISIRINLSNTHKSWDEMDEAEARKNLVLLKLRSHAIKDLVQKFMNDLLEMEICKDAPLR